MKKLSKEEKKEIKKFVKEKKYDQIYLKYGQKTYLWYLPEKVKKQNIKQLLKERRFLDIYNKYGEQEYKKYLPAMKKMDKYYELNSKQTSMIPVHENNIKRKIKSIISLFLAGTATVSGATVEMIDDMKKESLKENSELVEEYISDLKNYCENFKEEIKDNKLSEIDIYMKLMNDMWTDIDGYATPENEMSGCLGATLKEEKVGVCRNFADDISKKLNLINPDYNARSFFLKIDATGARVELAQIQQNVVEKNETTINEQDESNNEPARIDEDINNHAIVAFETEFNGKKITMFLDPTNPMIGTYKDGKIIFFNSNKEIMTIGNNFDKFIVEGKDYVKNVISYGGSFVNNISDKEYEKLAEMYSVEEQNKSLEKVKNIKSDNFKENLEDMINVIEVNGQQYEIEFDENTKEDIEKYTQNSDIER